MTMLIKNKTNIKKINLSILLFFLSIGNLYSQNLVAYYPFNNNAKDESGNNNNGEVFGATLTCDRFGMPSSAYAFNGNNYIRVNHSNTLLFDNNDDFVVTAWVKFSQFQQDFAGIVVKGPTNINRPGFQFVILNGSNIAAEATIPDNDFVRYTGNSVMDICRWHFVAVEFSTSKKRIKLFVDGSAIGERNAPIMDPSYKSLDPLFIGKDRNSVRFFKGSIDDIRIYRGTLSDSAIQSLYRENGWPNNVPSLKIIPDGPTEFCEGQTVNLTAPQCIRSYQWSNGATTPSISVGTSGTYRLIGYDSDGCVVAQDSITVQVIKCESDTATGDFTINIRSNCPGHSEEISIPFLNNYHSDTLIRVSFSGNSPSAFSYNGPLPKYLTPTVRVLLPITFRWLKPGSQKTVMTLFTSSGRQHRILLKTPVGNAITPFLSLSEVRIGPKSTAFDTCITVNNLLDAGVTLKDTVWLGRSHSFKLTAPALPFYVGPKGSVQLCFRVEPITPNVMDTLFLAGENAPKNCLACFYQTIEISNRPPRPMISSAINDPVTGESRLNMSAFPNPTMGAMTLKVDAPSTLTATILIIDENGRTIIEMTDQTVYAGANLIPINLSTLSSGRYSIVLQSGVMRLVESITVQQ